MGQRRNILVTVCFIVAGGPALLAFWMPLALTRWRLPRPLTAWQWLSIVVMALGVMPLVESAARFVRHGHGTLSPFVPTRQLVVSGFYRYVRNPMYLGVLAVVGAQAMLFRSTGLSLYACLLWLGFHLFVTLYEEPKLLSKHGDSYRRYRAGVHRWLPQPRPMARPAEN